MPAAWLIGLALVASVVFVGLDLRDAAFRSGWRADRVRARRNLAYLASNLVTMVALSATTASLTPLVPRAFDWSGLRALELVACYLVAELINWLAHWVKHRVPWLWTFHLQHHVETHYNTALTLHTHGLEVLVTGALMSVALVACGFSQMSIDVFLLSYFVANLYKHCSARMSLGPLDWLIVSPAFHRVHHAKHEDANFGSVLTVWDVAFGTARWMKDADAYALELGTPTEEPFGFWPEMLAFLRPARTTARARATPTPPHDRAADPRRA